MDDPANQGLNIEEVDDDVADIGDGGIYHEVIVEVPDPDEEDGVLLLNVPHPLNFLITSVIVRDLMDNVNPEQRFPIIVNLVANVATLKQRIQNVVGVAVNQQILVANGRIMVDPAQQREYIQDPMTLVTMIRIGDDGDHETDDDDDDDKKDDGGEDVGLETVLGGEEEEEEQTEPAVSGGDGEEEEERAVKRVRLQ